MWKVSLAAMLAAAMTLGLSACNVEQTEEGEMPEIDIDAEEGNMPEYEAEPADIDVTTETETIEVPDVDVQMEEREVEVPNIDVDMPTDEEVHEEAAEEELEEAAEEAAAGSGTK